MGDNIKDQVKEPTIQVQRKASSNKAKTPDIKAIKIEDLIPYVNHPFELYQDERLEKLAASMKEAGLKHPIIVQPMIEQPSGLKYQILSGHNRVEAAKLLGWETIYAIIENELSDEEAERIVLDLNLQQQSFSDWKLSQQIRVIKRYNKYIQETSQQGKRSDLTEDATCVHSEHKLEDKPKRPKSRDKIAKHLGISPTVFERYRSIAKLDDGIVNTLGEMLDEKRLGFMAAYRISQLKPKEITTVIEIMRSDTGVKIKGVTAKLLYDSSKEAKDKDLSKNAITEILSTDAVEA